MREPDMAWDRPEHWRGSALRANVEERFVEVGADTGTLLLVQTPLSQTARLMLESPVDVARAMQFFLPE